PADHRGTLHEARVALLLQLRRYVVRERIGRGALHRRVLEAVDPIELRLIQPREKLRELTVRLAGETHDESAADGEIRALRAPGADALQGVLRVRGAPHALEHRGTAV